MNKVIKIGEQCAKEKFQMTSVEANFNQDELEAPNWLNIKFFENVLNNSLHTKDIVVKSLTIEPATAKGDHYASVMYRANIFYLTQNVVLQKSVIIKTMPENEGKKLELLQSSLAFETEIGMYTKVIPEFEDLLRRIDDNTQLGVPLLYHQLRPAKVLIFEDIAPLGYTVLRARNPNLIEAKALLTKLAKWHAISYKINQEDPKFFDDFRYGHFMAPNLCELEPYYEGFTNFIELLESDEELKQYKNYFTPLYGKLMENVIKGFAEARDNPQPCGVYALCHGDFHYKNVMFKNNVKTQEFRDVMLLDFQMCYLGPMVNDLLYATYMMFDAHTRANHLDELICYHFSLFRKMLRRLGFKGEIPKKSQLNQELVRHKYYEIYLFTIGLPMWYAFTNQVLETDELFFDVEKRKVAWRNPIYVKEVKRLLPKFIERGYFCNI